MVLIHYFSVLSIDTIIFDITFQSIEYRSILKSNEILHHYAAVGWQICHDLHYAKFAKMNVDFFLSQSKQKKCGGMTANSQRPFSQNFAKIKTGRNKPDCVMARSRWPPFDTFRVVNE